MYDHTFIESQMIAAVLNVLPDEVIVIQFYPRIEDMYYCGNIYRICRIFSPDAKQEAMEYAKSYARRVDDSSKEIPPVFWNNVPPKDLKHLAENEYYYQYPFFVVKKIKAIDLFIELASASCPALLP